MSMSGPSITDYLRLFRQSVNELLALSSIGGRDCARQLVLDGHEAVVELDRQSQAVQLSKLTVDAWPPADGDDELVARCLQTQMHTANPRPSDIEGTSLAELASSNRVQLESGVVEVPLAYNRQYARNWGVLFDVVESDLSDLDSDIKRVKRRIAADGDVELLEDWRQIQQRAEKIRDKHKQRAAYFSPADDLPSRLREVE